MDHIKQRTLVDARFATAVVKAVEEHVQRAVGARPLSDWTDHDVLDQGVLAVVLAEAGLSAEDADVVKLEDVVSPLVFWRSNGETAESKASMEAELDGYRAAAGLPLMQHELQSSQRKLAVAPPQGLRMQAAMAELERAFDGQHPKYDREEHKREVDSGDTRLWDYWEWVVHQLEGDGLSVDEVVATGQSRKVMDVPDLRVGEVGFYRPDPSGPHAVNVVLEVRSDKVVVFEPRTDFQFEIDREEWMSLREMERSLVALVTGNDYADDPEHKNKIICGRIQALADAVRAKDRAQELVTGYQSRSNDVEAPGP